jgi:hypothetical protein
MQRKPVDAFHVRRTEIQKTHVWSKVQVKTSIRICHNLMEWPDGVAIESVAALLCQKARRGITGRVIIRGMVNTGNHCGNDGQWWYYVWNTRMIHLRGRSGKYIILNGERQACMPLHGTNLGILQALFCVPGGIYRPEFLNLNLKMTARHYPGQWSMCGSRCPYELVTPKPCSWGSLCSITILSDILCWNRCTAASVGLL